MQSLKNALKSNIKKHNIEERILSSQTCQLWKRVVAELLPNAVEKSMAVSLERGVLKIAVLSQDLVDLIYAYKARLIYAINSYLGRRAVYAISVEV